MVRGFVSGGAPDEDDPEPPAPDDAPAADPAALEELDEDPAFALFPSGLASEEGVWRLNDESYWSGEGQALAGTGTARKERMVMLHRATTLALDVW